MRFFFGRVRMRDMVFLMRDGACNQGLCGIFAMTRTHTLDNACVHTDDMPFGIILRDKRSKAEILRQYKRRKFTPARTSRSRNSRTSIARGCTPRSTARAAAG